MPKVHKPKIPGRPVVSSIECHTRIILKFDDHFLHLHAKLLPSYVKNTSYFIKRITKIEDIHKGKIFVMLDVKVLYIDIPKHEEIEPVKNVLNFVSQKLITKKKLIQILFLNTNTFL